jgi:hypothetical protein
MIDREFKNQYSSNNFLWVRKIVTSLFYYRIYRKLYPKKPWYTPKAIRFLKKKIENINRIFEFGTGNSSIWFAKRVKEYTGVEHDPSWHTEVTKSLKEENLINTNILFVPADENSSSFDWEKNWKYFKVLKHFPDHPEFRHYMATIDQYHDNHFECIVIDGKERIGCLLHALPKLSENGIIIFDDSSMDEFQEVFSLMNEWHSKIYTFGLEQTTFFSRYPEVLE